MTDLLWSARPNGRNPTHTRPAPAARFAREEAQMVMALENATDSERQMVELHHMAEVVHARLSGYFELQDAFEKSQKDIAEMTERLKTTTMKLAAASSKRELGFYEFVTKLELYFEIAELSPREEMILATSKLTGAAFAWWHENSGDLPETWAKLKKALSKEFQPYWRDAALREKLDTLTQTSTVLAYTVKFNELADQFRRPREAYFKARYLEGLKEHSSEIAALTELEDLQEAAVDIELMACRKSQAAQAGRGKPKNTTIPICQICDDGSRHRHKNCPLIVEAKKMSKNNPAKRAPSPSLTEQRSAGFAVVVE
ncbi:hypothetical protein HDU88_000441 [Geranomyces variabilis]|nr:hypothetical protein HDU88_000441 [Geranomyces variabilis]